MHPAHWDHPRIMRRLVWNYPYTVADYFLCNLTSQNVDNPMANAPVNRMVSFWSVNSDQFFFQWSDSDVISVPPASTTFPRAADANPAGATRWAVWRAAFATWWADSASASPEWPDAVAKNARRDILALASRAASSATAIWQGSSYAWQIIVDR